jgi:hypothetical protein
VERDFAWASWFQRLVKDYERLLDTVAGLHFVAFACRRPEIRRRIERFPSLDRALKAPLRYAESPVYLLYIRTVSGRAMNAPVSTHR